MALMDESVWRGKIGASGTGARFGGAANLEAFTDTRWVTVRGDIARTFDSTSTPVILGMRWSATMTSMSLSRTMSSASAP